MYPWQLLSDFSDDRKLRITSTDGKQNECMKSKCGHHGPIIRFPFQLKNEVQQQNGCAYPGFVMSCTDKDETILELPEFPALQLYIRSINYSSHVIELYDPQCLSEKLLKLVNSNITPFQFGIPATFASTAASIYHDNVTLFDCSLSGLQHLKNEWYIDQPNIFYSVAQDIYSCPIYAASENDLQTVIDLMFCTKMVEVSTIAVQSLFFSSGMDSLFLHWENPDCSKCEMEGKYCKLKNDSVVSDKTECFQYIEISRSKAIPWIIIVLVTGLVIFVLVVAALYYVQNYYKVRAEDQVRVEKFLEDYRALKPTRFSYADVKRITNQFEEKLGEGAHGTVFKGKLCSDIQVAVKILNNSKGDGQEFINEVATMGRIHHVNVVRLVGYCADGYHRALVYDFYPKGSLQKFITSPDDKNFLGWEQLQGIALGIAKGIEYLHQGCDQRILHFDINPHNVLLDDNCIPKITDFGLAKLCSRDRSTVTVTAAKGTLGYIAPEVFSRNFGIGNISYKSDIYSYGILLLEMIGGRKNMQQTAEEVFHVLYPEWIHNLLDGKDIHILIEDEEHTEIAKRLAIVGLWCIQWHPIDRPSMKTVVQMLEGEGDKLIMPPNPMDKAKSAGPSAVVEGRRLSLPLEVIQESIPM